jgi:hypothetical protein
VLVAEILRLSTGLGVQHYATESNADERLYYMSHLQRVLVALIHPLSGCLMSTLCTAATLTTVIRAGRLNITF